MHTIMKKKSCFKLAPILLLVVSTFADTKLFAQMEVLYNQVGYISHAPKMLLVSPEVTMVLFMNEGGKEVLQVKTGPTQMWEPAGDFVRKVDFSALTQPGLYSVLANGMKLDARILIADKPYLNMASSVIKSFYLQRASMPIEAQFAGQWARAAGHPDTAVFVHASAASNTRPEGTKISSPGGWYDAGDYNKYIVNSAISTFTLLCAVEDYPKYYQTLKINIPESASKLPDLLSEALYNYRWMLTMQDPEDGGVYHKLTNKHFDATAMPHQATNPRYVVMKSTAATLDFAAVAAHVAAGAANGSYQVADLGQQSLAQAEKAWAWAKAHPQILYKQPADVKTGEYGDTSLVDEWYWAACELFVATGKQEYADAIVKYYQPPVTPEWAIVNTLGTMSLLKSNKNLPEAILKTGFKNDFFTYVQRLVAQANQSAYGVSINLFEWGSNSRVANEGMLKLFVYQLTSQKDYLYSALSDLNYLLGCNATHYCFVTGFGIQQVKHIHHRPSQADGINDPVPGLLAGGPNLATFADCPDDKTRDRKNSAKSYVDLSCSYSTNEVAINWNAPLAYLIGGIDANY
jgi:endoglucanase